MGYITDGLTFNVLGEANRRRLPQFRNAHGDIAHENNDGSDWSLNDWYTAMIGEAGEAGNILKKVRRGDFSLHEARAELSDELADVATYLEILADQCGINLGHAIISKFNVVSKRNGCNVYIRPDGSDYFLENPE